MDLKYIIACIVFSVLCVGVYIIHYIRNKHQSSNSVIEESQSEDFIEKIENKKKRQLESKPWTLQYETYKTIAMIGCICIAVVAFIFSHQIILSCFVGLIGLLIPEFIVQMQTSKQQTNYEEKYATGLRQLIAGLKSGLSIHQSVEEVCVSPFVHDDIKADFQMIDADLKLGLSVKEAFQNFADRVAIQDAEDVAIAISMQDQVGGGEAKVIESIAKNISDRIMLRKEIKSMFAGSNATILSMDIIPFAVVAFIYFLVPGYLEPFFQNKALLLVFIFLMIFMGIGSIVIHKSVDDTKKRSGVS